MMTQICDKCGAVVRYDKRLDIRSIKPFIQIDLCLPCAAFLIQILKNHELMAPSNMPDPAEAL